MRLPSSATPAERKMSHKQLIQKNVAALLHGTRRNCRSSLEGQIFQKKYLRFKTGTTI